MATVSVTIDLARRRRLPRLAKLGPPAVRFTRCLVCGQELRSYASQTDGMGLECSIAVGRVVATQLRHQATADVRDLELLAELGPPTPPGSWLAFARATR